MEATAACTIINIPLKLAWGLILHKIEGHPIERPTALIIALDCLLQPGIVMEEMKRLKVLDLSLPIEIPLNQFEIVSRPGRSQGLLYKHLRH